MIVFIVPTGLGAAIGGHAGDATPALKLIAEITDTVITHPNVVNASAINEMPENCLYVEGSTIDRMLEGTIKLKRVKSNKILVAMNAPMSTYARNIVSAARATCGLHAEYVELNTPLIMGGCIGPEGNATGSYRGVDELFKQVKDMHFDALAIITKIDVKQSVSLKYFREGGVNPWGGIEAVVSRILSEELNKPVAHAPLESEETKANPELMDIAEREVINPRIAAEAISFNYAHCVLKGLHKSPRIVYNTGISLSDIECLITPDGCVGRPHRACIEAGIPVIAVKENTTIQNKKHNKIVYVENYLEAVGMVAMLRAGLTLKSIRRN